MPWQTSPVDEATIVAYIVGYLTILVLVFLYFLPGLILFTVLLLMVGLRRVLGPAIRLVDAKAPQMNLAAGSRWPREG